MATVVAHRVRGGGYTAPRPADIQPRTRRSHHCLETTARDPPAVLLPRPVRLHPGGDHACCVRRPANRRNRPPADGTAAVNRGHSPQTQADRKSTVEGKKWCEREEKEG